MADLVIVDSDLLRELIDTHNEPACGCRDSDTVRRDPCRLLAEARAALEGKRYDALGQQLLAAPDPFYAMAHLVGDHEARLDALVSRIARIESLIGREQQ